MFHPFKLVEHSKQYQPQASEALEGMFHLFHHIDK